MVAEFLGAESELFCTLRLSLFTMMSSIVPSLQAQACRPNCAISQFNM